MPNDVALVRNTSLWYKEVTTTTAALVLLEVENTALGEVAIGGVPGSTAVFSLDATGKFVKLFETNDPPGEGGSFDLNYRVWLDKRHPLSEILIDTQKEMYVQRLWYSCPPVLDRVLWKRLEHYRVKATSGTKGAGRDLNGAGGSQDNVISISILEDIEMFKTSISNVTFTETQHINCIFGMEEDNTCLAGYPGRDKLLFVGAASSGAAPANALYSVNGGGSWATYTTDPTPFAENSDINDGVVFFVSETQVRVVYGRAGDASNKAMFAYQDFLFSASTLTAASWNVITIAATSNNDDIEAMYRHAETQRLYIGAAGDVYVSTDNAESDPGTAVYTGSNAFAQFTEHESDIWVVGASNTILVERSNDRDNFVARTGPSGGGAFHSVCLASDDTLFAGNGTSLYKSVNEAEDTTGWSSLKDFGANHSVQAIQCINGSSQVLRVVVDDSTPGNGEIWHTFDGGNSWIQVTEVTNQGYNQAYYFQNIDKVIAVGDASGGNGIIHLLS